MVEPFVIVRSDVSQLLDLVEGQRLEQSVFERLPAAGAIRIRRVRQPLLSSRIWRDVLPDPLEPRQVPDAAAVEEVLRARKGHGRDHRFEVRRVLDSREPLHRSGIRQPECADATVRPRLPCSPLDRVVSVAPFILVRPELTVRRVPAAHVLHDDCIAAFDRVCEGCVVLQRVVLAVRGSVDERRKASVGWPEDIRTKTHAVPHRNDDVVFLNDVGLARVRRSRGNGVAQDQQHRDNRDYRGKSFRPHRSDVASCRHRS